jgi:hypothetical protein
MSDHDAVEQLITMAWRTQLGSTVEERGRLYADIKGAYRIRSQVVHGSRSATAVDKLETVSAMLDSLVRRVFWVVNHNSALMEFLNGQRKGTDQELEQLMTRLCLGDVSMIQPDRVH